MSDKPKEKADILELGSTFGRYKIERLLGRGGMGAVYEATHVELKKRVAIKTLLPSVAENAEVRTRFLREGQAVAKIHHPHVVDIYDVGIQDGVTYLVMEYLDGEDLQGLIKREGSIASQRVADIMVPVLGAISAAHEEGIIHRDLKPANIFLAKGRRGEIVPKVVDFGISKIVTDDLSEGLTATGSVLGTPFYMSPEQAHGEKTIDARSDQYSLGVILYQCVTGRRPFMADSMYQILHKIVSGAFEPPRAVKPDVPEGMEKIILRSMARKPTDRYASLREMGTALLPLATERVRLQWEETFHHHDDEKGATVSGGVPVTTVTSGTVPGVPAPMPPPPTASEPAAAALREPAAAGSVTIGSASGSLGQSVLEAPKSTKVMGLVAAALLLITLGTVYFAFLRTPEVETVAVVDPTPSPPPKPAEPATYRAQVKVDPKEAQFELDGQPAGTGALDRTFKKDGSEHTLRVSLAGHESTSVVFKDSPPPAQITLKALPAPEKVVEKVRPAKVRPAGDSKPKDDTKVKKGANDALILR